MSNPYGPNASFAMDQISMHEVMVSQVAQGLQAPSKRCSDAAELVRRILNLE